MTISQYTASHPRVLVIGGGLMGLWPAAILAQKGCAVTVLEANSSAMGASWAAAGMLAPASEAGETQDDPGSRGRFGAHSLGLWKGWAERFADAGHEVCWRPFGALLSAFDEQGLQRLERTHRAAMALDLHPKTISIEAARRQEPALSPKAIGALSIADEASVDPRLAMRALQALLQSHGGRVLFDHRVVAIDLRPKGVHLRCDDDQRFEADRVILAAGFQAGTIKGVETLAARLHPVKGQMLELSVPDNPVRAVMRDAHAYLVPRGAERMIIGATSEPGLNDALTHEADITALHIRAAKVVPALAQARLTHRWAGVRPQSVDGLPIIGPLEATGRFFANAGHYRNGVLLAPASAQMLCDMVMGGDAGPFAAPFSPTRFASC
jgi:glycine oxidase